MNITAMAGTIIWKITITSLPVRVAEVAYLPKTNLKFNQTDSSDFSLVDYAGLTRFFILEGEKIVVDVI
jgi:hypothetical protein